jgi:acetylglutamate kinase
MEQPVLIKIGGHEIGDPVFLTELATTIRALPAPVVIVHGGGSEISAMQQKLSIVPRYLNGVRITDEASLAVVEMVLCGVVNKRLVRYLLAGDVDALGLSGVDRGLVNARQMSHPTEDMAFTGQVTSVRGNILLDLLAQGITPVIAPICLGEDGNAYNVNADHVAGVLDDQGVLASLTPETTRSLIEDGTIVGGMIPKVQTAVHALQLGVPKAVITDLTGLHTGGGTVFVPSLQQVEV